MNTTELHAAGIHTDRDSQAAPAELTEQSHHTAHRVYIAAMIASAFLLVLSAV
jgi:hypothetical protein